MNTNTNNWLIESAVPWPTNAFPSSCVPVALVQAHDCYCVCLLDENDRRYTLVLWRTTTKSNDTVADGDASSSTAVVFLDANFPGQPLLQIAKASREHSCWFVYAIDNHSRPDQPQLLAWEITSRSFLPTQKLLRIPPNRRVNVWPISLHPGNPQDAKITSLSVLQPEDTPKPMLLIGTASGIALWSTQISIPMDFKIQKVQESSSHSSTSSYKNKKNRMSILSRSIALVTYQAPNTSIVAIVPILLQPPQHPEGSSSSTSLSFCVVHSTGKLVIWEMDAKNNQQHFHEVSDCLVMELLRTFFAQTTATLLYDMHVEAAVASDANNVVMLLCNVLHTSSEEEEESALQYWVAVQNDALLGVIRLEPVDRVTDFVMGSNGTPYMLLESTIHDEQQKICTLCFKAGSLVDVSTQKVENTKLCVGTMCADHTTHGVLVLPRNNHAPALVRARFLASHKSTMENQLPFLSSSSREVEILRSLFETWYTTSGDSNAPAAVSVTLKNPAIHTAVLSLAQCVPYVSLRNPMEQHLAYIKFLQSVGLYKFLPETTKWSLLAIGQSLEVVKQVSTSSTLGQQQQQQQTITTDTIGDILVSMQQTSSSNPVLWLECLHIALKAARDHRQEYGPPRDNGLSYDIIEPLMPPPSGLVWTSSILQSVLGPQLASWDALPQGIPDIVDAQLYLDILQWILEAYRNEHGSGASTNTAAGSSYAHAAQRVFSIVRLTFGKKQDRWLFALCRNHCYYEGVLTIHVGYTPCVTFNLTTGETGSMGPDIETGMPFKHYALKWLAEHGAAIGRALKLHEEWSDEFYEVAETTTALKPYQWMVDVLREKHNKVAEELLAWILAPRNMSLLHAGVVVGAAYASNQLVRFDDTANRERANERAKVIEKKQDLLQVQYRFNPKPEMFLASKDALNKAMQRIYDDSIDNDVDDYSTALEICSTFESENDAMDGALLVWMQALLADKPKWLEWIDQEPDLTATHIQGKIRKTTIFGQLMEYGDELLNENSVVAWSSAFDKLGEFDDLFSHKQMRRLITSYCGSRMARDGDMVVA